MKLKMSIGLATIFLMGLVSKGSAESVFYVLAKNVPAADCKRVGKVELVDPNGQIRTFDAVSVGDNVFKVTHNLGAKCKLHQFRVTNFNYGQISYWTAVLNSMVNNEEAVSALVYRESQETGPAYCS
jgi:hypothetical protein